MRRYLAALAACLAVAGTFPAAAQRAPLYGVWSGGIHCGGDVRRNAMLFMYGDGTGLLELGVTPFAPGKKPAVAMVSLRQPPEYDYVVIDRWMSNGVEPRPQLAGQIGANGNFTGQVLGDAHCNEFILVPLRVNQAVLRNMARTPILTAQREAQKLDPPALTAKDAIAMGLLAYGILGGTPNAVMSGNGGRGARSGVSNGSDDDAAALPRVGGNRPIDVQGNPLGRDVQGNVPRANVQ